jgi:N-acetylglucosamine-6-sulfatase
LSPRGASFNAVGDGGTGWVSRLPEPNKFAIAYNYHRQRQRLRALQAIHEMKHGLLDELREAGELENTFVFYTTANGYHISQHQMHPGRKCAYGNLFHKTNTN